MPIVLRYFVAAIFLVSGAAKAAQPRGFAQAVAAYRLLPTAFVPGFALSLPVLELAVGLSLLSRGMQPLAEFLAVGLLLTFSAAMVTALARGGRHMPCGCFAGKGKLFLGYDAVARNLALIAVSLLAAGIPAVVPYASRAAIVFAGAWLALLLITRLPTRARAQSADPVPNLSK